MITRKKKKCSVCSVFTEQIIKLEGKKVCFGCLEKLFPTKPGTSITEIRAPKFKK